MSARRRDKDRRARYLLSAKTGPSRSAAQNLNSSTRRDRWDAVSLSLAAKPPEFAPRFPQVGVAKTSR